MENPNAEPVLSSIEIEEIKNDMRNIVEAIENTLDGDIGKRFVVCFNNFVYAVRMEDTLRMVQVMSLINSDIKLVVPENPANDVRAAVDSMIKAVAEQPLEAEIGPSNTLKIAIDVKYDSSANLALAKSCILSRLENIIDRKVLNPDQFGHDATTVKSRVITLVNDE